jgi:alpha-L-fucosidase
MKPKPTPKHGAQRLSLRQLQQWQSLRYGMFIHFGMSTFDGEELSKGDKPSTHYRPDRLDVGQWISVARDAGMKYAVLTTKHVAGHCLWPTKQTDYHVGTSGNKTDVVEAFVNACARRGVLPGFYYCSWDNHTRFGSATPTFVQWGNAYTTQEYREFQFRQIEELLTGYGPIAEVWIDIPGVLGADGRRKQYEQIVRLQPGAVIMMNAGFTHGEKLDVNYAWPTDILAIERGLPCRLIGRDSYHPWWRIGLRPEDEKDYHVPGEVCDTIGMNWFYVKNDPPRSDAELLGMYLTSTSRRCNFLLDLPPNPHGVIERPYIHALNRLRKNLDRLKPA